MNQKTAQWCFVGINILAIPFSSFAIYDHIRILSSIDADTPSIHVFTGMPYFHIVSLFWVMLFVQQIIVRTNSKFFVKNVNKIFIIWFIACLVTANIISYHLSSELSEAGYHPCKHPNAVSSTGRGTTYIYQKTPCLDAE